MNNLITPKKNDQILVSLKNGREVVGVVIEIIDSTIVINPLNKKCLCIIPFEEISCYYLTSKEIQEFLEEKPKEKKENDLIYNIEPEITGKTHKDRIESIQELRKKQKEIEKENIRAKLTEFKPTNYEVNYGIPTTKQPMPESIFNTRKKT